MTPVDVACAIIVREDGCVLLAERPPGRHLAGYLEFPGGKVEAGETPRQALERELDEELCLKVDVLRDLGTFTHDYPQIRVRLNVFVVRPLGAPRTTESVHRFLWLGLCTVTLDTLSPADHGPWLKYVQLTRGETL